MSLPQRPRASATGSPGASAGLFRLCAGSPRRRRRPRPLPPAASASAAGASASAAGCRRRRVAADQAPARGSAPSWIASPPISAASPRTRPVIGEASTPTNWPCSTSRAGSLAIDSICSIESALAAHRAALELRASRSRAGTSRSPWRPAATSPRTNVSAVGPSSSSLSASAPALSAARSVSVFLTTRSDASASRQLAAQLGGLR